MSDGRRRGKPVKNISQNYMLAGVFVTISPFVWQPMIKRRPDDKDVYKSLVNDVFPTCSADTRDGE